MAAPSQQKTSLANKWHRDFQKALELDGWGQVEEAKSGYETLVRSLNTESESKPALQWSYKEMNAVKNLMTCMRLRCMVIKRDDDEGISAENMKAMSSVFENLFKRDKKFPLDLSTVSPEDLREATGMAAQVRALEANQGDSDSDDEVVENITDAVAPKKPASTPSSVGKSKAAAIGLRRQESRRNEADQAAATAQEMADPSVEDAPPRGHIPPPVASPKRTVKAVYITIEKIGLKDFDTYVDPRVSVYIVSGGRIVEGVQDTKISSDKAENHIVFNEAIKLKQSLDMLLPGGAVFFEFKHFKKDKNRISTRCWCFLEREDLAPGAHVLELYKKPADLKRKNIHLHTVKELYLHVNVEYVQEEVM